MPRYTLAFILSMFASAQALATTVLKVSLDELTQDAPLIIEAEVLSKQVRASKVNGRPCTYFRFNIIEVVKGEFEEPEIELCFAGGTLNGLTMKVSDMNMPTVGETGIYFIDAPGKEPIHPLHGWSQGHYLVKKDNAQIERVAPAFPATTIEDEAQARTQSLELSPSLETFKKTIKDQL